LLVGGVLTRRLTLADLALQADPAVGRVLRALDEAGAADRRTLARISGLPRHDLERILGGLCDSGYVDGSRDGRWRTRPVDLRRPELAGLDPVGQDRLVRHLDAKLDRDLRAFARAAAHPSRLGPWAGGPGLHEDGFGRTSTGSSKTTSTWTSHASSSRADGVSSRQAPCQSRVNRLRRASSGSNSVAATSSGSLAW
jgi:hypothetical protein